MCQVGFNAIYHELNQETIKEILENADMEYRPPDEYKYS